MKQILFILERFNKKESLRNNIKKIDDQYGSKVHILLSYKLIEQLQTNISSDITANSIRYLNELNIHKLQYSVTLPNNATMKLLNPMETFVPYTENSTFSKIKGLSENDLQILKYIEAFKDEYSQIILETENFLLQFWAQTNFENVSVM